MQRDENQRQTNKKRANNTLGVVRENITSTKQEEGVVKKGHLENKVVNIKKRRAKIQDSIESF